MDMPGREESTRDLGAVLWIEPALASQSMHKEAKGLQLPNRPTGPAEPAGSVGPAGPAAPAGRPERPGRAGPPILVDFPVFYT